MGLAEVADIGPGGNFLTAESTLLRFRQAYFQSDIFPNLALEAWEAEGRPQTVARLRSYTQELIDGLDDPGDYEELTERGESFIASWRP